MKDKTKAYAAGIFDAEGCISAARSVRDSGCVQYHIILKISNINRKLMKFLVSNFGGTFKQVPNNDGQIYNWTITNHTHMLKFLSVIRPYLQIKEKEANLAFEYCALNGASYPKQRELLHQQMGALKDRSVETITRGFSCSRNLINAYYAGLIDGEGDLTISQNFPRKRKSASYYGHARGKNTFKPIIDLMPSLYGGNLSTIHLSHPRWAPQRVWRLSRKNDLEKFLLQVLPYLILKRSQAKLLLNFVRSPLGPQDPQRFEMYKEMQTLNQSRE